MKFRPIQRLRHMFRVQPTIRLRLIMGIIAVSMLILLAGAIGIFQLQRLSDASDARQSAHHRHSVVLEVHHRTTTMINVVSILLPMEDRAIFTAEVSSAIQELQASENQIDLLIEESAADQEAHQLLVQIQDSVEAAITQAESMVESASNNDWLGVRRSLLILNDDQRPLIIQVDRLVEVTEKTDRLAAADFEKAQRTATFLPAITVLVSLLLAAWMLVHITRQITFPLEALSDGVRRLSEGSLDQRINVSAQDELGQLAEGLNGMAVQLQTHYAQLEELVAERTKAMSTSAEVSRHLSTILEWDENINGVTERIKADGGYSHIQIYFFEGGSQSVLRKVGGAEGSGDNPLPAPSLVRLGEGLVGRAASDRQVLYAVGDELSVDLKTEQPAPGTKAQLAVPIMIGDVLHGILEAHLGAGETVDESVVEFLQSIARQMAITHQNVRLYAQAKKRAKRLLSSAEISRATSSLLELDKLMAASVELICRHCEFCYAAIFMLDDKQEYLLLKEDASDNGVSLKNGTYRVAVGSGSIVGWVAANNAPRISLDVSHDPLYSSEPALNETRSEFALPMAARGRLLGVLDVRSREIGAFEEADAAILQILADQIAINIDNARLFKQVSAQLNETEALVDLNKQLTSTLDLSEIYDRAVRVFSELLEISHCLIYGWEQKQDAILVKAEFSSRLGLGAHGGHKGGAAVRFGLKDRPGTERVLKSHLPLVRTLDNPSLPEAESSLLTQLGQTASLELALVTGTNALGSVELFRDGPQSSFEPGEIQLAQALANQTAIALNNAQMATEARERVAVLSTINRLSSVLSLAPTLKDVFDGVRREVFANIDAVGMSIMLLTPEGDKLSWIYGYEYGQEVDLSSTTPMPISRGFSGSVARSRKMLLINEDVEVLHDELNSETVGASPDAWLGLPLIVANELIGVLAVENDLPFPDHAIELLNTLAGPLAIAIHNLLQFEEVQEALEGQSRQRVQLQAAAEVAAAATSTLALDELMQRTADLIKERFSFYYVGLFLVVPDTNRAVLRAGTGDAAKRQIDKGHYLLVGGKSLIGGATGDGVVRITQDVSLDQEWHANPNLPRTKSELAIPLRVRDHIIGALTVQSISANAFSSELVSSLQTMSDQLAVAIENTQLLMRAEARARRQQNLNEISAQLYRATDVDEIIGIGAQAISQYLGGSSVELSFGRTAPAAPTADGAGKIGQVTEDDPRHASGDV